MKLTTLLTIVLVSTPLAAAAPKLVEADVCIYGGTSGGVAAAVQASRMGKTAVIAEPGKHLGGMTAGGLSAVDIGDPRTVGGIAREYFTRLVATYGKKLEWDQPFKGTGGPATGGAYSIEPHVAEQVFNDMAKEAKVGVHFNARLAAVKKDGPRIVEFATEDGTTFRAKMFIDATYEGDLMAKAGVAYTLTREGNAKYGETYNGIHYPEKYIPRTTHQKPGANGRVPGGQGVWDRDLPLDPYVTPGDPKSGLLPLIQPGDPGKPGDSAPGIQAYCYRLCLTKAADRIPIQPPANYDPKRYEIVARFIAGCIAMGDDMDLRWFSKHDPLPNNKWDFNTATFGGNMPGENWDWPEASYTKREEISKRHEEYHRGLLHFLATDPRVPAKVRSEMKQFGLPKDEFADSGGWPHQLYIREGRRMVSDLVMTEHHTFGKRFAKDPVSLGSYGTDTHEIRRIVKDGVVIREGKTATGRGGAAPYGIGYAAIVPKAAECDNLFVTFALSASHTAFSSIRMEPVFMATSQSAATAASLAIDDNVSVQKVDYAKLRKRLLADRQVLAAPGKATAPAKPAAVPPTVINLALEPVPPNTRPGPAYTAAKLDYAMVLGIDRTPKGRLWAAWIAGGDSEKGLVVTASSDDNGATWTEPRLVIDPSDAPGGFARRSLVGNFWTDPTGKLWLFYDQSIGYFDGRAGVWAITCDNPDAKEPTWSAPRRIWHGATLNKPTVLANGDWLLPVSLWDRGKIRPEAFKEEHHDLDEFRMANVLVSTDRGATWERRGGVAFAGPQFDEHSIVELKDGRLWMLARTSAGLAESFSSDKGRTWSEPKLSAIKHTNSRFFFRRLASGNLLLVKHGKIDERTPKRSHLTAFLSDDDGKTWKGGLLLDERTGISYPDGFQAPDGSITIAYDRNRAADREIILARFTEADVLAAAKKVPLTLIHKARGNGWLEPTSADLKEDRTTVIYDGVTPNKMVCDTTLRVLPDGSWALLFLAGGDTEPSPKNYTAISRSTDQGKTWSPAKAFDVGFPREGNTIGQGPTEVLVIGQRTYLYFSTHGKHWNTQWRSWVMHSDDSGKTWSKPEALPGRLKDRTFIRPHLVAKDGRILLPFQHYIGPEAEQSKPPLDRAFTNPRLGVLISADGGKTWSEHGNVRLTKDDRYFGWAEPTIAETADGTIVMFIRADRLGGVLFRAESKDGGKTWPDLAVKTDIPNPGSKATLFPIGGDGVALLHNSNPSFRSPLSLWISYDGLKTWPYRRVLVPESSDGPKGRLNYPDGFVSADGKWLNFVYDDNRHRAIFYAAKLPEAPPAKDDPALVPVPVNTSPGAKYADSTRAFQGIPGIERAKNGRLWAVWYGGGPGEGPENYVTAVTSGDDGKTWSAPKLVIDPPGDVRAYDPTLWIDPAGKLWLFWAQSYGWWDGRSGVWAITTDNPGDESPKWSEPRRLMNGIMMNKPTVRANGDWLFPVSIWERPADKRTPAARQHTLPAENAANVYVSRDSGQSFERLGGARVPKRVFDEHMTVERNDGSLWMLVRAGYGIGESTSNDGKTWSDGKESGIPHVNSRFFIRRLASGKLLLVTHEPPDRKTRSHLTAKLSSDDGKTWTGGLMIDDRPGVSYPDGVQADDGTIRIIYDFERTKSKQILMATFTEADVAAGKWQSPAARQRVVVNQATGERKK